MERTEEALRERVRETPLSERLKTCEKYIASMCAERRPPKMTIPLQHYDEDFYIYTTLADAQATIAALTEALECALLEKPLPNGEYAHHAACNGDRRKPAGTVGVSCSCRVGRATIAALQARVQELEQWVQDQSTANLETMRHTDEMQSRAIEAESQLTQRTAERDALKQINDTHMKTVMKLSHVVEQRTAERDTARRRVDELEAREVDVVLLREDLEKRTAELERVRGERDDMQRAAQGMSNDLTGIGQKYDDLRTLILALPKVEGEIEYVSGMGWVIKHNGDVRAIPDLGRGLVAALLQHRQGMEG